MPIMRNLPIMTPSLKYFPICLALLEAIIYLSNDAYLPALPEMIRDLDLSTHMAALSVTVWIVGASVWQILLAPLTERWGYRAVLNAGTIIFIISSICCVLTQDIHTFLAMRFWQGSTVGAVIVAGYACIHAYSDQKTAIKTIAWMGSITVLAPAFGPLLGSIGLSMGVKWRWLFLSMALFAGIIWPFLFMNTPPKPQQNNEMQWGLIFKQYYQTFINTQFLLIAIIVNSIFAAIVAWITVGAIFIHQTWHTTPLIFGVLQAVIFLHFIFGTMLVQRIIEHRSPHAIIKIGLMIVILASISMLSWLWWEPSYFLLLAPMGLFNLGAGCLFAPCNRLAMESIDTPMTVKAAAFSMICGICTTLGSLAPNLLHHHMSFWHALAITSITCCVISTLCFLKTKTCA